MSVFSNLKVIIPDMYDVNRNKRDVVIGTLKSKNISEKAEKALYDLVEFLTNYNVISEQSIEYIYGKEATMKDISIAVNGSYDSVKYKKTLNMIANDQRKVEIMFGKSIVKELMNDTISVDKYAAMIKEQRDKRILKGKKDDRLIISVRDDIITEEYDGDFIADYGKILSMYSRKAVADVEKLLYEDKRFSGYYNYITRDICCSDDSIVDDREKLDEIVNSGKIVESESDSLLKSVENMAVRNGVNFAINELCNRIRNIEETSIYARADRLSNIELLMMSDGASSGVYNGMAVSMNNKIIVCNNEVKVHSQKAINLDKLINSGNASKCILNLRHIVAMCKEKSITKALDYSKQAVEIVNGAILRAMDLEMAYKSIGYDEQDIEVDYTDRYIALRCKYGLAIVMNSNEIVDLSIHKL